LVCGGRSEMTIPNYLATFRRAVHEQEAHEKNETNEKSTPLISSNSFVSYPRPSGDVAQANIQRRTLETWTGDKKVTSSPFAEALSELESRCPDYVEPTRWQQAIRDAASFLARWGHQAHALGWTREELLGLHPAPLRPAPTYCRLSRYDCTGLIWLLQGRAVVALTDTTAVIGTPSGGTVIYRKDHKPAFGPLGDSLDDIGVRS
jgi:hypothetical protein